MKLNGFKGMRTLEEINSDDETCVKSMNFIKGPDEME